MKRKLTPGSDFSSKEVQQDMSRDENSTRDAQCADGLVCHAFPEKEGSFVSMMLRSTDIGGR